MNSYTAHGSSTAATATVGENGEQPVPAGSDDISDEVAALIGRAFIGAMESLQGDPTAWDRANRKALSVDESEA